MVRFQVRAHEDKSRGLLCCHFLGQLMDLLKLLLILSLISIIPGQLIRISVFGSVILTLSDIIVAITLFVSTSYLLAVKKSVKLTPEIILPAVLFSQVAAASTILALNTFSPKEVLLSSMFLVRFLLYFSFSQVVANVIAKVNILNWLKVYLSVGTIFALLGYFQILLFPDLSSLTAFGWDPHQTRLVSTFLDPNFAGGFLSMVFAISLALYLKEKKVAYLFLSSTVFLAIILTFSRSSYLAAFTTLLIIGLLKSPKILIAFLVFFAAAALMITPVRTRIIGAATIDETSQARIQSWQRAITIFQQSPVLGVGFNTYRFAQARSGFFSFDNPEGGHSGAGSDSSILLTAATTGVIGLTAYAFLLLAIAKAFAKKAKESALHLGALSAFVGLIVHSQFVNSLFFPQIMLPFWFIVGLVYVFEKNGIPRA